MEKKLIRYAVNSGVRGIEHGGMERSGYDNHVEYFDSLDDAEKKCIDMFEYYQGIKKTDSSFVEVAYSYVMPTIFGPGDDEGEDYCDRNDESIDWERIDSLNFDSRNVSMIFYGYGVFRCRFCEDEVTLLDFKPTEEAAAKVAEKLFPGGLTYYMVRPFMITFPSKIKHTTDAYNGYVYHLENGARVEVEVYTDSDYVALSLIVGEHTLDWDRFGLDDSEPDEYDWDYIAKESERTMEEMGWIS